VSYPRPRTASAHAAARAPAVPGVAQAQARIRAVLAKTKPQRPKGVNVLTHPNVARPSLALVADPQARGGLRQASVQEALAGAEDIAARKDGPARARSNKKVHRASSSRSSSRAPSRGPAAVEYECDFEPSTNEHPHQPMSLVAAARMQQASVQRLQPQSQQQMYRTRAGQVAPAAADPADEFGMMLSQPEPSMLDDSFNGSGDGDALNSTAGLMKQEAAAQARHGGNLEEYLRSLALPSHSEERRAALAALAAKAQAMPPAIYSSPLAHHRAPRTAPDSMSHRSEVFIRGSSASNALPPQRVQQMGAMDALQQIRRAHQVQH
jgi:hypothetical protein